MEETKKRVVSKDKLLEAGVYFGHKKATWNPKMKPYISKTQKGIHIIDIEKTSKTIHFAYSLIKSYAEKGATFIFVGTRDKAKATVKENALRTNSFYVDQRWLGGTLTNARTIFRRVRRMGDLEKLQAKSYEGYTKKEGLLFERELVKLQRNLLGIRNMRRKPNVMIIADPSKDMIAIKEAKKLGVKTIGIIDTNNDPSSVDIAIPANDDSIKSITLIMTLLADAIAEAKGGAIKFAYQADSEIVLPVEERKPRRTFNNKRNFNSRNFDPSKSRRPNNKFRPAQKVETKEQPKVEILKPVIETKVEAPKVELPKANINKVEAPKVELPKANINKVEAPKVESTEIKSDLSSLKVAELRKLAKEKGLKGYSALKKGELVKALS